MFIVKHRQFFYIFSFLLFVASFLVIYFYGLKFGIEFTGGTQLEIEYMINRPEASLVHESLNSFGFEEATLQPVGEKSLILRAKTISEEEHQTILKVLGMTAGDGNQITEKSFDSIGPIIGSELKRKSVFGIGLAILMIVLYIAFAFRKVSKPVSSFKYGLIAIVALMHDVAVPTGLFAILGHYYGAEVDILFVTALLTVLGFSIHDTIVVFDRVRENLRVVGESDFEATVGKSLRQTMSRSINTSLTVVLVLLSLLFLGGETTKNFALALIVGVVAGTYSSIFIASPLLVTVNEWQKNGGKNN